MVNYNQFIRDFNGKDKMVGAAAGSNNLGAKAN